MTKGLKPVPGLHCTDMCARPACCQRRKGAHAHPNPFSPLPPARLIDKQAMADYATLIWELKEELSDADTPVIGFGGWAGRGHRAAAPWAAIACTRCLWPVPPPQVSGSPIRFSP